MHSVKKIKCHAWIQNINPFHCQAMLWQAIYVKDLEDSFPPTFTGLVQESTELQFSTLKKVMSYSMLPNECHFYKLNFFLKKRHTSKLTLYLQSQQCFIVVLYMFYFKHYCHQWTFRNYQPSNHSCDVLILNWETNSELSHVNSVTFVIKRPSHFVWMSIRNNSPPVYSFKYSGQLLGSYLSIWKGVIKLGASGD